MDTKLNSNLKPMSLVDMTAARIRVVMLKSSTHETCRNPENPQLRPLFADNSSSAAETFAMMKNATLCKRVVLNVCGERYDVPWDTLARFPCTRLGRLKDCRTHEELKVLCDDYNLNDNEFYFNWQSQSFSNVLQYYRTGRLHAKGEACALSFDEDLQYWGLDDSCLASCCQGKHLQEKEDSKEEMRNRFLSLRNLGEEDFGNHDCSKFQRCVWNILEKPESSRKAQVVRLISVAAIFTTCLLTLSSIDSYHYNYSDYNVPLTCLEVVCMGWFTLEYELRFLFAPMKCKFLADILNIIDLFFVLHYVISIIWIETNGINELMMALFQLFNNVRVLTIMKLARHLKNFRILGVTLIKSSKELGLLLLFLCIGIVTFSQLIFLSEYTLYTGNGSIRNIWDAFWWATLAMTSGSVCGNKTCPESPFGKVIAVACVLCGVIVVTLPIPVIMNNFSDCYKMQRMRKLIVKRCKDKNREPIVEVISGRDIQSSTSRRSVV